LLFYESTKNVLDLGKYSPSSSSSSSSTSFSNEMPHRMKRAIVCRTNEGVGAKVSARNVSDKLRDCCAYVGALCAIAIRERAPFLIPRRFPTPVNARKYCRSHYS
ncbi:hypothetical protein ALC62_05886, partial [Cyphomyrmex costatus]